MSYIKTDWVNGTVPAINASNLGKIETGIDAAHAGAFIRVAASGASAASVGAAEYVCDGTGDQVEINAAIAALPSTGGVVVLSEGTFNIASSILIENDNVTLLGQGAGQRTGATQSGVGTKLKAASGIATAIVKVQRAADDRPVYGVLLRDFTVDGNSQGTAVDGIIFRSNRGHIDHVHVHYCTGNGVRVKGYVSWDTYDTQLSNVQVGDCTDTGILLDDNGTDVHILGAILYNSGYNIRLKGSSAQITACHLYDATTNNIKFDGGGSRSKIVGCKIEGAGQHGINIDSTDGGYSDIQIIGNGLSNNGDSANNTYDHIMLQGPSGNGIARTQIVGNSLGSKSGATNRVRYGVNMSSTACQSTVIIGNSFGPSPFYLSGSTHQLVTGPINDGSSGSFPAQIKANAGAAYEASGTATVPSGSTSVAVTHGLAATPSNRHIMVTPTNNKGSATEHWISAPGATTFTINVDVDPGVTTATFAWQARLDTA